MRLVEAPGNGGKGGDLDALGDARLVADEESESGAEGVRQRFGERREENAGVVVSPREMRGAMEGDDRLARPGGPRDARRPSEVALDELALVGVEEDRPGFPRRFEGSLELFAVRDNAEAPLRVGMRKRIGRGSKSWRRPGGLADGEIEKRLTRFLRKVLDEIEERRLGRVADFVDPLARDAVAQQRLVVHVAKERFGRSWSDFLLDVPRNDDVADGLADLDELRGAGDRVPFDLPPLGPGVRVVVVAGIAKEKARFRAMNDDAEIAVYANGPEVRILRPFEAMQLHPRTRRIQLQIERARLDGLLLLGRKADQTLRECIRDQEVHLGRKLRSALRHETCTSGSAFPPGYESAKEAVCPLPFAPCLPQMPVEIG